MSHHTDINLFIVYYYNTATVEHLYKVFEYNPETQNPFDLWDEFHVSNHYLYRYIDSKIINFKSF